MNMRLSVACLLALVLISPCSPAETGDRPASRIDSNVIYGMYSGLALLMDVHHPAKANGRGVIFIAMSGWNAWLHYGARPLKNDDEQLDVFLPPLLDAGYTVFVINHRATPRFAHPAQVEDAQRAVRFIRHAARGFGIDPDHIGVVGVSTGGHLANMLGVVDPGGLTESMDPVNHVSAEVQCVVAFSTLTDFTTLPPGPAWQNISLLTGVLGDPDRGWQKGSDEYRMLQDASPVHHVSAGSAPTLLVHGEKDADTPLSQAQRLEEALRAAGVPVRLIGIPGQKHTFYDLSPEERKGLPDFFAAMTGWLDTYLLPGSSARSAPTHPLQKRDSVRAEQRGD